MKKGMNLGDLTSEVEYRTENRRDFIVGTDRVAVSYADGRPYVGFKDSQDQAHLYELTRHALGQVIGYTDLPVDRAVSVLLDGGHGEKERKAMLTYINAVLVDRPGHKTIKTVGRFWEPSKAVAFVGDRFTTPGHFKVLTSILELAAQRGLNYYVGDITQEDMVIVLLDSSGQGVVVYYSEVGLPTHVSGFALTSNGGWLVPGFPAYKGDPETMGEMIGKCLIGTEAEIKKYISDIAKAKTVASLPSTFDVPTFLRTGLSNRFLIDKDRREGLSKSIRKQEATVTGLINGIAHYAKECTADLVTSLKIAKEAGRLISFPGDVFNDPQFQKKHEKTTTQKREANPKAGPAKASPSVHAPGDGTGAKASPTQSS